jgi:hypothetical protein
MRDRDTPRTLFDDLHAHSNIRLHVSEEAAWAAITDDVMVRAKAGASVAVAVATNEQANRINALVQNAHAAAGHTKTPGVELVGSDGLPQRVGDRIMTRYNNTELQVANRDTWTVHRVHHDRSVTVTSGARTTRLPSEYVEQHTHLAYASTEYGVQGATVDYGHGVVTDASTAGAIYVAGTRGRHHNTFHLVADTPEQARELFVAAMNREAGDRGLTAATHTLNRDLEGVILPPAYDPEVRAARLKAEGWVYQGQVRAWETACARWEARHPDIPVPEYPGAVTAAEHAVAPASAERKSVEDRIGARTVADSEQQWATDYQRLRVAQASAENTSVFRRAAAQKEAENARRDFLRRWDTEPSPHPAPQQRVAWVREATQPGANAELDQARAAEQAAIRDRDLLVRDPVPALSVSSRPAPGMPEEEAAKDAAFTARQASWDRQSSPSREHVPVAEVEKDQSLER